MVVAIKRMMVHKAIVIGLKLEYQAKANKALVIGKIGNLIKRNINKPNSNASTADKEELYKAIKELEEIGDSLQMDAFDHFKKLLYPTLQFQWKDIVNEECKWTIYINLKCQVPGKERGSIGDANSPWYLHCV